MSHGLVSDGSVFVAGCMVCNRRNVHMVENPGPLVHTTAYDAFYSSVASASAIQHWKYSNIPVALPLILPHGRNPHRLRLVMNVMHAMANAMHSIETKRRNRTLLLDFVRIELSILFIENYTFKQTNVRCYTLVAEAKAHRRLFYLSSSRSVTREQYVSSVFNILLCSISTLVYYFALFSSMQTLYMFNNKKSIFDISCLPSSNLCIVQLLLKTTIFIKANKRKILYLLRICVDSFRHKLNCVQPFMLEYFQIIY